jgi:hypothetical protein
VVSLASMHQACVDLKEESERELLIPFQPNGFNRAYCPW